MAIATLVFTFIFYYFSKAKLKKSKNAESQFAYLMIFTSCAVAFAHGSNDVANAIGPLFAINQATSQLLNQPYNLETPLWILFLVFAGIVLGLATLGYRVMKTIGEKIVKLTPSKGFLAQLGYDFNSCNRKPIRYACLNYSHLSRRCDRDWPSRRSEYY